MYLCFVEVKYRKNSASGRPEEAVDHRKQCTICRVADYYLLTQGMGDCEQVRFDVVAVLGDEITLHKNAFFYHKG